jgi:hypothetical protein
LIQFEHMNRRSAPFRYTDAIVSLRVSLIHKYCSCTTVPMSTRNVDKTFVWSEKVARNVILATDARSMVLQARSRGAFPRDQLEPK